MVQSNSFSSGFDAVFGRGLSLFLLPDGGGGGGGRGGGMDRGEVEEVNVFFAFLFVEIFSLPSSTMFGMFSQV